MKNPINNNTYFNLIQPKIFNLLQYHISEDATAGSATCPSGCAALRPPS